MIVLNHSFTWKTRPRAWLKKENQSIERKCSKISATSHVEQMYISLFSLITLNEINLVHSCIFFLMDTFYVTFINKRSNVQFLILKSILDGGYWCYFNLQYRRTSRGLKSTLSIFSLCLCNSLALESERTSTKLFFLIW